MSWNLTPNKNIEIYFWLVPWMEGLKSWAILTGMWLDLKKSASWLSSTAHVWLLWCDPDVKCGSGLDRTSHNQAELHVFWQKELFLKKTVSGLNDLDIFQSGMTRCVWITQQWKTTTLHQGCHNKYIYILAPLFWMPQLKLLVCLVIQFHQKDKSERHFLLAKKWLH